MTRKQPAIRPFPEKLTPIHSHRRLFLSTCAGESGHGPVRSGVAVPAAHPPGKTPSPHPAVATRPASQRDFAVTRQMGSWRSTLFRALRAHYEQAHPGTHGGAFSLLGLTRASRVFLQSSPQQVSRSPYRQKHSTCAIVSLVRQRALPNVCGLRALEPWKRGKQTPAGMCNGAWGMARSPPY